MQLLLVHHSNLGLILHRFGDIAGFCAPDPTPISPYFGDIPGVNVSRSLKLFSREIIFEVFQPCKNHTWTSQTDGQTDGRRTVA